MTESSEIAQKRRDKILQRLKAEGGEDETENT